MTLASGDLTTPARVINWLPNPPSLQSPLLPQLITSMTALIYNKLNRARLYQQVFTRTLDGVGNYQLVLPDWPVLSVTKVQMGAALVNPAPLPNPTTGVIPPPNYGYGYRIVPWSGNLPGDPGVLEFQNGYFWAGVQNIQVTYSAGYAIVNESATVPAAPEPFDVIVLQPQGIWCRDGGVTYANGTPLVAITSGTPTVGQYRAPTDTAPGTYTFAAADTGAKVLITYSFIPADLEEACIQMVAERVSYRDRIGVISKALGGQETVRFLRGSTSRLYPNDLPPEIMDMLQPYISVLPPAIGAPV